jgi:hypothetical protein
VAAENPDQNPDQNGSPRQVRDLASGGGEIRTAVTPDDEESDKGP